MTADGSAARNGRPGVDHARIEGAVREILLAIGEDPDRDGLRDTPSRVARAMAEQFAGLGQQPRDVLTTVFDADHDEMVLVRDIEMYSTCVPSRQEVNAVGGQKRAADVAVGDELYTLVDGEVRRTSVVDVSSHQVRELVEVVTERGAFRVTPDHPVVTPDGWMQAGDAEGTFIEWTAPRKLCRSRLLPAFGHAFGYVVGAVCADGTVGKNYVSLVANDQEYAKRFAEALRSSMAIDAQIQPVSRPSGFTKLPTPGFRVRVVSSYLADMMRQYVGGDANHLRQRLPRVVLHDEETFRGFLDGYIDGDGHRQPRSRGSKIISGNVPFLEEIA
jgi:GTP cyclohydrolase I